MPLLVVKDLTAHFRVKDKIAKAADGVDFSIDRKQTVGLVGESGCGKSVTALSLLRLLPKQNRVRFSGTIEFEGQNIMDLPEEKLRAIRGKSMAMIFQEPMTSLNPVLTVGDQIAESLMLHKGQTKKQARTEGIKVLEKVGISDGRSLWDAYPGELSGGMRQRVMIAMAMAPGPKLLIADEPTTALDVTVQAQVLRLIHDLKNWTNAGVLLVTHDLGVVAEVCDKVCVMYAGQVVEDSDVVLLFNNPLHPYTQGLLRAMKSLDEGDIQETLPGQVAPATDFPPGCRFHPRCEKAFDRCRTEAPEVMEQNGRRVRCHLYFPAK